MTFVIVHKRNYRMAIRREYTNWQKGYTFLIDTDGVYSIDPNAHQPRKWRSFKGADAYRKEYLDSPEDHVVLELKDEP